MITAKPSTSTTTTSTTRTTPVPGQFTGKHMALLTVGFFGVVVAVNVTMAISASMSWTGLVVPNSYVASQEYQTKRNALLEQKRLGWHSALTYTPGSMDFTVNDGAGNPIDLGEVEVLFNRPVGTAGDQGLTLNLGADGRYAAPLRLGPGVWEVTVTAGSTEHGPFEFHERFKVE